MMTDSKASGDKDLGFDSDKLHRKYLAERDKRLRKDGNAQYVDMSGEYEKFSNDPYVKPGFVRDPLSDEVEVVVLGGGFGGLIAAARLREAGVKSIRVIEQGGDFGGTWYWNRYPGIRCDIESYIYIPLLEEVGTMPTEKYAGGAEILAHCQAIGQHYDLYTNALFQTEVTKLEWDERIARWIIRTNRNDAIKARFVVAGSGPLHRPKLPGIPGIKSFKGESFHTSRWNYDYTGGDSTGNLTRLKDKRVAVIGTGATTIQIVPHLAESAKQLFVFQRTPSAVDERNNKPTDPVWYKNQKPGWQKRRKDNFLSIMIGAPQTEDLVSDKWTEVWGSLMVWAESEDSAVSAADRADAMQIADYQKMNEIRRRIDAIVKDPKTADSLKPWYNLFCKRPLYSDEFLQAFNNPNVTLVDTQGRGVDRVTENALVVNGQSYEIDCIIYATGFQVGAYTHEAGGYELIGRNGVRLNDRWRTGIRSLHGIQTHGFPNFFIIGSLAQATVSVNYPHVAQEQATHAAQMVARCLRDGIKVLDITLETEDSWAQIVKEKAVDRAAFEAECTPGYFNNEGDTSGRPTIFGAIYGGGPFQYFEICEKWRDTGFLEGSEIIYE